LSKKKRWPNGNQDNQPIGLEVAAALANGGAVTDLSAVR